MFTSHSTAGSPPRTSRSCSSRIPTAAKKASFRAACCSCGTARSTSSTTVADRTATYDQAALIETIAEIIHDTQPTTIRTLDVTSNHGHDHVDHEIVGALALLALATTDQHPAVIDYRGYDTAGEPANKIQPIFDFVHPILGRYEACAAKCGAVRRSRARRSIRCTTSGCARRYAFGFRAPSARASS